MLATKRLAVTLFGLGGLFSGCAMALSYPGPIAETADPELCSNGRDDDFNGILDEDEPGCAPFWPTPVALPSPIEFECPQGWHEVVLGRPDESTTAEIDVEVSVCEPGAGFPVLGCETSPSADMAHVATQGTGGDGSPEQPFGSIAEAMAGGGRNLWLLEGRHDAAGLEVVIGEELIIHAACNATLFADDEPVRVGGALVLAGMSVEAELDVGDEGRLEVSDAFFVTEGRPLELRTGVGARVTLNRVAQRGPHPLHLKVGIITAVEVEDAALGPLNVTVENGRLSVQRAALDFFGTMALSGEFATASAQDVILRLAPSRPETAAPLVQAIQDATLTLVRAWLQTEAAALRVVGASFGINGAVVTVGTPEALVDPSLPAAISCEKVSDEQDGHGCTADIEGLVILHPLSDGLLAAGAGSSITARRVVVYRDSRINYEETPAACAAKSDCGPGLVCDGSQCAIPWSAVAVGTENGACLDLESIYVEGVDGVGIQLGPGCSSTHELREVTISRVHARECHNGLRSFRGRGIDVDPSAEIDVSGFLVENTSGCGLSVGPTQVSNLHGASVSNLGGICVGNSFSFPVPPDVVFRNNGNDKGAAGNNCFKGISVGCPSALDVCP